MAETSIEWTDKTWNPTVGCSMAKGSEKGGCLNCYAARMAARNLWPGKPLARRTASGPRWTGEVRLMPDRLDAPLHWRKPLRIFVNSMSDLFHEELPLGDVARVLDVIAAAKRHTFQVLTKRAARMRDFFVELGGAEGLEPPPNLWLGVSVEDQRTADERIPLLLQTPAAVRFVSYEPALGPLDLRCCLTPQTEHFYHDKYGRPIGAAPSATRMSSLAWVIVGGESGPGARPCDVALIRSIVRQCREAGVPVFVKQLGTRFAIERDWGTSRRKDRKGGDPAEWPEDLRVRQFPTVR